MMKRRSTFSAWLIRVSRKVPFLRRVVRRIELGGDPFLRFPPGHFYSPLPSKAWATGRIEAVRRLEPGAEGVDLNEAAQLALLQELGGFAAEYPFSAGIVAPFRYGYENEYFPRTDGAMLYGMLRRFRPSRVIEVGSGYSSALMLDVNERFLGGAMALSFVEPYPERLLGLLSEEERGKINLHAAGVQSVPMSVFEALEAGDLLFIDSSHVSKLDSDVNHLFFDILPRLAPGVLVHVHDIPYPFEYPDAWFREGRAWNEAYLLRAFLQFNDRFEVVLWPSFLGARHAAAFSAAWPDIMPGSGFSIYLRKKA